MDCRFQSMCLSRSLNYDNGPIFKLHHYSKKRYSCNLLWCKGCHVSALAYPQLHINDELVEKAHLNAIDFIWHIEWLTKRPKKDTCITLECLCAGNTTLPSCKLQSTSFPSLVPFFFFPPFSFPTRCGVILSCTLSISALWYLRECPLLSWT